MKYVKLALRLPFIVIIMILAPFVVLCQMFYKLLEITSEWVFND